jgi:hypothetical protein
MAKNDPDENLQDMGTAAIFAVFGIVGLLVGREYSIGLQKDDIAKWAELVKLANLEPQ